MRRRHLLALVGSLAAGSGCTGSGGQSDRSTAWPAPVPSPSDAPTTPDSTGDVEITAATVQPCVVALNSPDAIGIVDDADQYLVVDVVGDAPDRSDIEFRFSGVSYTPEEYRNGLYRDEVDGGSYGDDGGPLVFALPETGDGGDAELAWGERSWTPPHRVVDRLEAPLPTFSVSLDGPDTAAELSDEQLTATVTNEGGGTGRYVFALNRIGPQVAYAPVARVAGELSAGESETQAFDAVPPEGGRSTRYLLDVPGQQDDLEHTVEPADDN